MFYKCRCRGSDRHQDGGTTAVLVCKFIAKLLLGGLLCEPLGIHGIFCGLGHLRGEATHHFEILRGAAGTSGALGHVRLGLSGAPAAAWGTPWWTGGHDGAPLCLGTVGSVG
jgi:hypothetical protein